MRVPLPWSVVVVFAITFLLYRNGVLNHVYEFGGGTDTLIISGFLWRGDWTLPGPPAFREGSYLSDHFVVLMVIPTLLSHLFTVDHVEWYALVIGFLHAFATAAVAWVCWRVGRQLLGRPYLSELAACALGLVYAICALQAVFMEQPHPEIAIPGLLIAMMAALALRRYAWASVFFILLLAAREDGGLHAMSFLATLAVVTWWRERRLLKWEAAFSAIGLAVSIAIIMALPRLFPGVGYKLVALYVGDPPFAHLTVAEMSRRLEFFLLQLGRDWLPLALLYLFALVRRDATIAVGAIAVTPWILIHVLLVLQEAGYTLAHYYGFPILAALAWPALAELYRTGPVMASCNSRYWFPLQAAVIAATFMPPLTTALPGWGSHYRGMSFLIQDATLGVESYRAFTRAMHIGRRELGRLGAAVNAISLAPHIITRSEWIDHLWPTEKVEPEKLESLLILDAYWPCHQANAVATAARMPNAFEVPGTRIILLTRKSLDELPTFRRLLAPTSRRGGWLCNRRSFQVERP